MDKYEYMLKNDGRLKTSPIKNQYSDTTSNQLAELAKRRRKEEEERRKREEEERKRRQKLDAEAQAIKTLAAENNRNKRLANQEEQAHPIKTTTKSGSGRGFDEVSSPIKRAMDNLPQSNSRQSYQRWSEGENVKKYKDYSNGLGEDVRKTIDYSRQAGLKDDEIKNSLIPPEDNTIEERLQEIGSKLRAGRESWGQTIQEGWYEKELQDMLSKETVRQMNGLPNKADVIQKWMADHPELGISEDANILDKGIRFLAEGTRQQLDSYSAAAKNWESWAIAGAIIAGASLLAPVTGGSSLLVGGTLLGNATLALGSLGALKLGMSYGSMKNMAELEMTDKYNQYIEEGIHPEIAKKQAATVGAFNGLVEFMQIDSAFSTIPGVGNLLDNGKKLAGKEFTKELTKVAANYGVDLLGNALEESIQEATGLMGLELSKYLENAPNPNTLGGLKALAKTFDKEEYRERVIQSGLDALQSMWLSPIVSSGVREGASRGVSSLNTKAQAKQVNGYYTQDEKFTQAFLNEQKKMLLTDKEENQIDLLIKDYNETRDEQSLAYLITADQVLESIAQREDTSNQERELIQKSRDKINNIVSKAMYDAKDENSDIEYKATNNQDIESEITSTDFEGEIYTPTFNEYAIERFNDAKNAGVLETIKEELIKGTSKSEISNKITKALPRKMRNPLDVATMINAVESVQKEVNAQKVMNNIYNYEQMKDYKPTEVIEETQTEIEATEEPQTDVEGVSDTIVQTDIESPTESLVEPVGDIETELETTEVESATEEYKKADVVKVPVSKVFKDEKRFQFRYHGTTKKLDGATFNQDLSGPLMLFRDEFGDLYVFNGHHRLRLAEQSGVEYIDARIYDSKDYTAEEVRALGAIVNIAENHAEAIDVAKVLRDSTLTTDELKKYLSPRSKVMRDGIALSNLNDWIFTQVATSKIPTDIGVVIGNELPGDEAGQNQIVKAIDKLQLQGKDITASILTEMVAEVKGTAQETFTEQTLFGEETFTKSVQYERATLVEYVKGQLKSKKSLLKSVTKDKNASMLESLGNKIAADENAEQLEQSELALLLLDKTLNYQGTKVNKLFNDLALEYSQAEPKDRAAIKRKALDELISLMEGGNLLGENATTKQRKQAKGIDRGSKDSSTDGKGRQESWTGSSKLTIQREVSLDGVEAKSKRHKGADGQAFVVAIKNGKVKLTEYFLGKKGFEETYDTEFIKGYLTQDTEFARRQYLYEQDVFDLKTDELESGIPSHVISENQDAINAALKEALQSGNIYRDTFQAQLENHRKQIITEEQEEIAGQEALFALREQPQVEIIADEDVKNTRAYKSTIKIVEALQKNVFFNGLKVNYSNKSGKIVFDSKKELKERGYEHYEVGKTYYIYGAYDNRTREITLNSEAARDTILEEAIHDIQARIQEINPELGVTIQAWENEVREQAAALGYDIPGGHELLAQALVFSELGYASSNKDIANLIAVDDEIVVGMKAILGRDVLKEGQGLVESETAKKDRELKGMYENYAKRIFTQDGFLDNLLEAEENRKTEIRAELANARAATYYHPSNGQYVIVSPSTKGAKYQVTTFSPKFGPISDGQFDTIDEVADRLIDNKFYYKANEIHYQLKQFTRGVVDELYGIAISRGYRTDNSTRTNGESISFSITDNQIIDAYHDARVGNFSAHDFDELIKDNKDISVRVKNNIIRGIFEAAKKGLDVDNSEVTFLQYLHRFHGMPTRFSTYLWDTPLREELTSTDRIYYEDGEIVTSTISYTTSTKKEILEGDTGVKETKWIEYDNLSEAISQYKMAMDRDVSKSLYKDFPYLNYKEIENIEKDYIDFRDNVETYRHKGIKTDFDRQSHHAISYETKAILENEIYYVDGIKVIKNPTMVQIQEIYYDVEYMRPGVLNKRTAHESTFDNKGNNYVWNTTLATREAVETAIKNELGINVSLENVSKGVWSEGDILYQLKAATDTTEFKNWFKDSKVVDSEGNPLVVYHGTADKVFDEFDINMTNEQSLYGRGFYFTENANIANKYVQKEKRTVVYKDGKLTKVEQQPGVFEVYLSIKNPFDINEHILTDEEIAKIFLYHINEDIDYANGIGENISRNFDKIMKYMRSEPDGSYIVPMVRESLREILMELGYDGITHIGGGRLGDTEHRVYIAFNPTQIKSIYNNGMFNEYDPNINYQLKESSPIVDVPGFYSNLENVINTKMGKRAKASDLMNMLTKNGVKPEEMEWFEIASFLEGKDFVYKNEILDHMREKSIEFTTKDMGNEFESYTLEGGDNYRFNAYVYKNNPGKNFMNEVHFGHLANVIGHTRYKDRVGTNGEKILLIEELQSDWHQKGRQEGYSIVDQSLVDDIQRRITIKRQELIDLKNVIQEVMDNRQEILVKISSLTFENPIDYATEIELKREEKKLLDRYWKLESNRRIILDEIMGLEEELQNPEGIPDAPLKESITDFLIKTAIKDAVEGGYDYIAWTTGTQQAERWNVGNWVSVIGWIKHGENSYNLNIMDKEGNIIYNESGIDLNTIGEVAGNDIAKQIAASTEPWGKFEGEGLHLGGEFYKKLYDNYVPRMLKKYGKKWGLSPSMIDVMLLDSDDIDMLEEANDEQLYTRAMELNMYNEAMAFVDEVVFNEDGYFAWLDEDENIIEIDEEDEGYYERRREIFRNELYHRMAGLISQPSIPVTPQMIEDVMTQGQPLFQLKEASNIQAMEISEAKLKNILKLGNFPISSVTNETRQQGDISLLFTNEITPDKAINLNDIQAVIAPDTLSPELEQMLKDNGINLIEKYNPGEDRQVAIDRVLRQNDVSFQLKETDTNTKEFKKWFRDSKVVDAEGNPMVVYHGTGNEFSQFDPGLITSNDYGYYGKGFYFTTDEAIAEFYTMYGEGNNPNIMPVYLSTQNPYIVQEGFMGFQDDSLDETIKDAGYDSVIVQDYNGEIKHIAVFNPTQIKSIYNYGAWDVNDANIYYQLKEGPDIKERSWGQTVRDANLTEQWLSDLLTSNKFMYEVKHNEDTLIAAAKLIEDKGEEYIEARLLSDLDNDAVLMAASQILTYKYMESGEQDRAIAMLDKTAEKATSLGQAIQILSVWGRQTPEGMLRYTSKKFRDAMTDRDRQMVTNKTKLLTEEFNKLNRQAIKDIDLVGIVKQVEQMTPEELAARDIANKGGTLPEGGFTPEMLQPFTNVIDDGMRDRIIDTINKHYEDGKGRLVDKLQDLGLNEVQARTITNYTKEQIKSVTKADKQSKIDSELSKKKYERNNLVDDILEATSDGVVDENTLKNLVGEKEGMPVLSKELVDYIYQQGQYINSLPQGRQRDVETAKMMKTISDHMPVSFWSKVNTFQTIAQLLNFKTTIRNLVGNDMFRRLDTFTLNFLGTPIDAALAKATGNSRTMLFRPIKANQAQKLGYKEGWRLGLEDALLGINTSDEGTQYELRRNRVFTTGPLAQAEMVMDIALRATDRAAVMATFRDSLAEQMELAGVDTATDEMTENAMAIALYRTFQDDTVLSQMFSTLKKGMNKIGSKDGQFGLGDLILKYPKTPANILGRAIDYSPAGVVVTALKLARDTSPKGSYLRQRMVAEGLSRAIMGTGIIAIGAVLAKMGILTGSNPDDDEDIYKLEKQYGLRDFSVNVSALFRHIMSGFTDSKAGELRKGDRIASYDWAEPIAMGLAVGADTELGSGEAIDFLSTVVRAVEAGTTTLAEQPLLTGLSNLFRYGDITQGMTQVLKSMPSSFTPTLFSHVAQFLDGRDTDPYTFYGTGQQAWNLVQNRIPGLRGNIPSRYSVLGDEKRYYPEDQNLVTRALNIFLNPAITSKYMPTNEAQMIFDLYEDSGNPDIVPRPPQKTYTIDKVKYTFTPESWEEMSKWLGKRYRDEIGYAMNTYMKGWSAEEQVDEIEWIIKEVKNEAKEKVLKLGTKIE